MVKRGLEFCIWNSPSPFKVAAAQYKKNLPRKGELAWQVSRYLWRPPWNFKIIFSRPLFIIILSQKWCQISVIFFCVLPGTKNLQCSVVSKLETDDMVTAETVVWGPGGLLAKLGSYFVNDYRLINRRHDFITCRQAGGEGFNQWWETKLWKAKECALKDMSSNNWLEMELIRGVSDTELQKKLLQVEKPTLPLLVKIAQKW